jgi:hypothetical protein
MSGSVVSDVRRPNRVGLPARQVHEQGAVNCCFSCALSTVMEARDPSMPPLAPLYHFFFANGSSATSLGITIAQAQGALLHKGMCSRRLHDFSIAPAHVALEPSLDAVADGMARRPMDSSSGALLWQPVSTIDPERAWKRRLAAGSPLLIALQPNPAYFALARERPVLANIDGPYDSTGHAVAAIGYADDDSLFVIQDSRGTGFGLDGQWFLPYALATSPFVVTAVALVHEHD